MWNTRRLRSARENTQKKKVGKIIKIVFRVFAMSEVWMFKNRKRRGI